MLLYTLNFYLNFGRDVCEKTLSEVNVIYHRIILEGLEPGSISVDSMDEYILEFVRLTR